MTRASVGVMVTFYFAVVLVIFFTILCIRIAQMQNGNCVIIQVGVRGLGLRSGLRLALGSILYFYFVEVLRCLRYFTHSASIISNSALYPYPFLQEA